MHKMRKKLADIQAKQIEAGQTLNPSKIKRLANEAIDGAFDLIGDLINEVEKLKGGQCG